MITLRFITDLNQNTTFNMAADQYLLHKCINQNTLYIRFYSWENPTITLGYMQKPSDTLFVKKMAEDSVNWIRRPTGGRTVLHWGDLTYSCIFPKAFSFMGTTVKESYALITRCLINGLNLAGIECTTHDSYDQLLAVKREVKLPCFLAPNRDEIMVNNRKLVGSAQKRVAESILQHGSIPITSDYSRLPDYLLIDQSERDTQKNLLLAKSIYLHELNPQITIEKLLIYLKNGFSNVLRLKSVMIDWTEEELYDINKLASSDEFLKTWVE